MFTEMMRFMNRMPSEWKRHLPALLIVLVLTACGAKPPAENAASAPAAATAAASTNEAASTAEASSLEGEGDAQEVAPKDDLSGILAVTEDGAYTSKEEVALYLHTYGHLPGNFITKREAQALGWDSSKGNLDKVAPGKSIGGDRFGNYEGNLPNGHRYQECDINYTGGYRGAERLVFSGDGLIFYTDDHYNTFEQLYEGE